MIEAVGIQDACRCKTGGSLTGTVDRPSAEPTRKGQARLDSNQQHPAPKAGALPLSYLPVLIVRVPPRAGRDSSPLVAGCQRCEDSRPLRTPQDVQ